MITQIAETTERQGFEPWRRTNPLTDRQTADAVQSRIDWKYLLCLELTDSGFDHTVPVRIPYSLDRWSGRKLNL